MEFKQVDIAKLVLGYLREQKCYGAFNNFLQDCSYLSEYAAIYRKGKYLATRVGGLSLKDYMAEYATVYTIVQERIEASDYYSEKGLRTSLVQQLLYLLDRGANPCSRTSTPIMIESDSESSNLHRDNSRKTNSRLKASQCIQSVPDVTVTDSSFHNTDVNTTSTNNLPGNCSLDNSSLNLSRLRSEESIAKIDKSTSTEDELNREKSQECEEIFTQTFLENSELIEKLANNINKEVSAKSSEERTNATIAQELNEAAIETIIQHVERDMNRGYATVNKNTTNQTCPEKGDKVNVLLEKKAQSTPSEPLKKRLRSSAKQFETPEKATASIEEQNNEAIQSIVAASLSSEKQSASDSSTQMASKKETELHYDSFVQNSLLAEANNINEISSDNCLNTNNLLMVQPNTSKSLQVNSTKPYYLVGNQPFFNVNLPQTPFKVNSVLTEQDIMAMPTIIVCENNQQSTSAQPLILPTLPAAAEVSIPVESSVKGSTSTVQSLSEYITLYQCNEPYSPVVSQPQSQAPSHAGKSKFRSIRPKKPDKVSEKAHHVQIHADASNPRDDSLPVILEKAHPDEATTSIKTELAYNYQKSNLHDSELPLHTPKNKCQEIKTSRSTPKNGSHVRQLDFSTPEKWCPLVRCVNISPKDKETSARMQKSGGSKAEKSQVCKTEDLDESLSVQGKSKVNFTGAGSTVTPTESHELPPNCASTPSWDSDLRAMASSSLVAETNTTTKQKRKRSEKQSNSSASLKRIKDDVGNTEDDVEKIENTLTCDVDKVQCSNKNQNNNDKVANKRRSRIITKTTISPEKTTKRSGVVKEKSVTISHDNSIEHSDNADESSVEAERTGDINIIQDIKLNREEKEEQYSIINRNTKPRIKKKCNMENSVKKLLSPDEVVLTTITKIKSCEILDDSKNKLVLSPSKLNANKRTLVEIDNRVVVETGNIASNSGHDAQTALNSKSVSSQQTDKSADSNTTVPKRDVPVLETPDKFDSIACPKTPGVFNSPLIDTPFTKAVIDQLTDVDINAIPTPRFPITPNFPFTPATRSEQSPYPNRPTDYSTSSSYYQPSDTEQNKSLEQLIEESRRLEKLQSTNESSAVPQQPENKIECADAGKSVEIPSAASALDKLRAFNNSMVGKKNLQLIKLISTDNKNKDDSSCSSSSSSDSESSSSTDEETDSNYSSSIEDYAKLKKNRNSSPYSLRPRKSLTNNASPLEEVGNKSNSDQNVKAASEKEKEKESSPEKPIEKNVTFHSGILREVGEKLQRTIARFKDDAEAIKSKETAGVSKRHQLSNPRESQNAAFRLPPRDKNGKFLKKTPTLKKAISKTTPKSRPNLTVQKNKGTFNESGRKINYQKSDSIYKNAKGNFKARKESAKLSENNYILHLSSDDENLQPLQMVETELLECSDSPCMAECTATKTEQKAKLDKESNDVCNEEESSLDKEAESLVKGLKQWGIYLIPNKSAKKMPHATATTAKEEQNTQLENGDNKKCDINKETSTPSQDKTHSPQKTKQQSETAKTKKSVEGKKESDLEKPKDLPKQPQNSDTPKLNTETLDLVKEELQAKETPPIHSKHKTEDAKSKIRSVAEEANTTTKKATENVKKQDSEDETKRKANLKSDPKEKTQQKIKNEKVDSKSAALPTKRSKEDTEKPTKKSDTRKVSEKPDVSTKMKLEISKKVSSSTSGQKDSKSKESVKKSELDSSKQAVSSNKTNSSKTTKTEATKHPKINKKPLDKHSTSKKTENKDKPHEEKLKTLKPLNEKLKEDCDKSSANVITEQTEAPIEDASTIKEESGDKIDQTQEKSEVASNGKNDFVPQSEDNKDKPEKEEPLRLPISNSDDKELPEDIKDANQPADCANEEAVSNTIQSSECTFDIQSHDGEMYHFNYDYSQKPAGRISDYNFSILGSRFSANFYISEIDAEVEKILTFSPFEVVLDIPSPKPVSKPSVSHKVESCIDEQPKKKPSPLAILYDQLIKPADNEALNLTSPLQDLYECEPVSRSHRRSSESRRNEQEVPKKQKSTNEEKSSNKELVLAEQKDTCAGLVQGMEVKDGVIMLNSNSREEENENSFELNDELMDYAVMGSQRLTDSEGEGEGSVHSRKRRLSENNGDEKQQGKKQKTEVCQELLRNIDVDSFLKKLHGET